MAVYLYILYLLKKEIEVVKFKIPKFKMKYYMSELI